MRTIDDVLYVFTQGSYLTRGRDAVEVRVERSTRASVPFEGLGGITCFGQVSVNPTLVEGCAERDIALNFFTENGRFLASIARPDSGHVNLRRRQYEHADDLKASADIARGFLSGKIANSRSVLRRAARDHAGSVDTEALSRAADRLTGCLGAMAHADLEALRGIEGDASRHYFAVFGEMMTRSRDAFGFSGRSRRPPLDRVNSLLSFFYTVLCHDCRSALEGVGLDPQVGFLHRDRPGRPSLALDLMEEFRSVICDRLVLSIINLSMVGPDDFRVANGGAVLLADAARSVVLGAYGKRKQDEVEHPFLKERMSIALIIHSQARLLSRYLQGSLESYPPYTPR